MQSTVLLCIQTIENIQSNIRKSIYPSTVITISHRYRRVVNDIWNFIGGIIYYLFLHSIFCFLSSLATYDCFSLLFSIINFLSLTSILFFSTLKLRFLLFRFVFTFSFFLLFNLYSVRFFSILELVFLLFRFVYNFVSSFFNFYSFLL